MNEVVLDLIFSCSMAKRHRQTRLVSLRKTKKSSNAKKSPKRGNFECGIVYELYASFSKIPIFTSSTSNQDIHFKQKLFSLDLYLEWENQPRQTKKFFDQI